ncbi:MAG: hypothetical protein JSU85_04905 [Candidatus Zixiibacteriota bacterium]|nr:MAG: hypothetical protein JSU85_04905 [candidate division Zixibacteria bacterium]
MGLKTLMIIKAVVCLVFGLLLLFVPGTLLVILGSSYGPGAAITAREYGAALIGVLMLTWLARNAEDSTARRAIITNLFVYDGVALIAMLILQLSGAMNALGWGVVFIYLFFTVTFGYYMFPQKKAAK